MVTIFGSLTKIVKMWKNAIPTHALSKNVIFYEDSEKITICFSQVCKIGMDFLYL